MKEVKASFYLSTGCPKCYHQEVVTIEVNQEATEEEIDIVVSERFKEWRSDKIDSSFCILKE